ncbi:MAG: hypothetical protein F2786_05150 [Actinobacteria bacterium]|uniref:Unannotated protein n=1 Tax=freshwater metagenome TaxID=449393 RepID=A0A6J7DSS4_9ZZZZ|nr:hypothetical protein [Actinomycetota bacterium]
MISSAKKFTSGLGAIAIALGLSFVAVMPAVAAAPTDAHITLISPVLDATNTSEAAANQKMANGWVGNGWFGDGLIYQRSFVPVGSTINLTYHVADKDGKPLVGQDVKLRINKGYSVSTAILQVDNVITSGIDKPPLDQGFVIHKTDAFGNVTFEVRNLDPTAKSLAEPEPQPESWTSEPNISEDGLNDLHSQMLPEVAGEKPDHSVISEFHYYIPSNPVAPVVTHPTIRLVSPVLTDTNSFVNGKAVRQAYVQTGSTVNVVYKVTDDNGAALANQVVKLHVNKAFSSSNAKMTNGKIATDSKKDSSQGNDQALLEGTTDGYGFVVFSLRNTDTKGEAAAATSADKVLSDPTKGAVFSQIHPEITGATTDVADVTEFHFFGAPAAAAGAAVKITTSAKKTGGKYVLTLGIAGASGKSAKVEITGLKVKTEKVTVANQGFTYTVSAGAKVVKVTIDGKAYTSKITVK